MKSWLVTKSWEAFGLWEFIMFAGFAHSKLGL